jgi:hypothetical protein
MVQHNLQTIQTHRRLKHICLFTSLVCAAALLAWCASSLGSGERSYPIIKSIEPMPKGEKPATGKLLPQQKTPQQKSRIIFIA